MCICFSAMLMTFKYALPKFSPLLSGSLSIPSDILRRVPCCNCKLNMFKSEFTIFTLGLSIGSYPGLKISCLIHTFLLTYVTSKRLKQIHNLLEFLIQFYFHLDTFLQLNFLEEFSLEKWVPAWFWPTILIMFLFCSETWKRSLFLIKVSLT